jgi:alpha-N-arabinofuranosidase
MDRYDPDRRIGLAVDEWGAWHDVEPGTNPRFLFQQNTLRDALLAGITLNIFNSHCRRLVMANIAQTVNVLQAMILTEGNRMILTPTYHVFHMYACHQDAYVVDLSLDPAGYTFEGDEIPAVSASASMEEDSGNLHISLCHTQPESSMDISCELRGWNGKKAEGTVLTDDEMTAHNSLDAPERLKPVNLDDIRIRNGVLECRLPPQSVAVIQLEAE